METCKKNNLSREPWKRVPNAIIERYHYNANDKQETPPNWVRGFSEVYKRYKKFLKNFLIFSYFFRIFFVFFLIFCKAKTVKPEDFQSIFQWRCIDISNYEKIHYIGDIEVIFCEISA